jgi:hypothetical protein
MSVNKLKGDQEGGILDMLVNKGKLPEVSVTLSTETIITLGVMTVIAALIIILFNAIIKTLMK